ARRAVPGDEDRGTGARTKPPRGAAAVAHLRSALPSAHLGDGPGRARSLRRRRPAAAGVVPRGAPRGGSGRPGGGPGEGAPRPGLHRLRGGAPLPPPPPPPPPPA